MIIETDGIYSLEPVGASSTWFFGMDYASGDLYEAEELFNDGSPLKSNRCIFVKYPEGRVIEPVVAKESQYLGEPRVFRENRIYQLMVDFIQKEVSIMCFDPDDIMRGGEVQVIERLPISIVEDCYNLQLAADPLILTRETGHQFQLLWSQDSGRMDVNFRISEHEVFMHLEDDKLYFNSWWETLLPEYDYREQVVVRNFDGEIIETKDGSLFEIYPSQYWILK
ncbi:MAG: hypothetical protein ACOX4I_04850 [Anaerovoracaceae bacterium]|jgi:hypothetical protein